MGQTDPSFGYLQSQSLAQDVVVTEMVGRIDLGLVVSRRSEFQQLLWGCGKPKWMIDMLDLSSFDPRSVSAGGEWFRNFRAEGGREIICLTRLVPARMAAHTLAFAWGLQVKIYETRSEGWRHLGLITPTGDAPPRTERQSA